MKDAPQLDKNTDQECIQFIDKYITEDEEMYHLVQQQVHHHTRSCKKNKNKTCRYSSPRTPAPETLIARVPEGENSGTV